MVTSPGYWRTNPSSRIFYDCESPTGVEVCEGNQQVHFSNQTGENLLTDSCRSGHQGVLCSDCIDGYGKTYGICNECESSFKARKLLFVIFGFAVFVIFLYGLTHRNVKQAQEVEDEGTGNNISLSVIKIVINWLQMAAMAAKIRVSTNEAADTLFSIQDMSSITPWQFSTFNCVFPTNYFVQFYTGILIPPACIVLGVIIALLYLMVSKKGLKFGDLSIMVIQLLWFLTYTMVSQTIMEIFSCRRFDGGLSEDGLHVLSTDLSISCYDNSYRMAKRLGFVFAFVYVGGIPLQVLYQLVKNRNKLQERTIRLRYLFLFNNYRRRYYW